MHAARGDADAHAAEVGGESGASAVLAEDEAVGGRHADVFGAHDGVGGGVLEDAVLVDAGFVGEGVGADDGLVALDGDAGELADEAAGGIELAGLDAGADAVEVAADTQGHDELLQGAVARAFAEAVDGAFDAAGAAFDGG